MGQKCPLCGGKSIPHGVRIEHTTLYVNGHSIYFTPQEADFLRCLMRACPEYVPTDRVMMALWTPDDEPENAEKVLHVVKHKVAAKLEGVAEIKTFYYQGYALRFLGQKGASVPERDQPGAKDG